ncbi:hypothetical protein BH11PLA2_BH11PLA2_37460 [soil metagenome]
MSSTAEAWLTIPERSFLLGGVHWSEGYDALEDANNQTVSLTVQLEQVIDGLFSDERVPHFAYVIFLLRAMKFGGSDPQFARLHAAYSASGNVAALARNAGVLIGELCAELPWRHRPTRESVLLAVQSLQRYGDRLKSDATHEPPLPLAEALPGFAKRIRDIGDDQLQHWFRFGRGGILESQPLVEAFDSLPTRVLKLLSAARLNTRLIGAASLVPVLDAAITLPPRKHSPEALPLGGYADVTTRGDPDRLLPSQFALDPDDFVRRFAERELLYFKREEPHTTVKPERVIVLDQGVRTWGSVRLALAGAALSLLKADARRIGDVRVYFTATLQPVDLRRIELESLVDLFAASDLTPHPVKAFMNALTEATDPAIPRDIILLTHPNNLHIPVLEARERRRPADRIFALAVRDDGVTTLDEICDEGPRTLRSFKLDLAAAEAMRIEPRTLPVSRTEPAKFGTWTGDVEPIGFPFRPGLLGDPQTLAFSGDGEWLAIGCRDGTLHALAMDGTPPEVLPRAFQNGVLKTVHAILGVTNGIVVCGTMRKSAVSQIGVTINAPHHAVMTSTASYEVPDYVIDDETAVAHYDFATRNVKLYRVDPVTGSEKFTVDASLTSVMILDRAKASDLRGVVDLQQKQVLTATVNPESFWERDRTWDRVTAPPHTLPVLTSPTPMTVLRQYALLVDNSVIVIDRDSVTWDFLPMSEGKPLLAGKSIHSVIRANNVLAMRVANLTGPKSDRIFTFRGPEGDLLGELSEVAKGSHFTLSCDGTKLARCFGKRSVGVHATFEAGSRLAAASPARLHDTIGFDFQRLPFQLRFRIGHHLHTFSFQDLRLQHRCETTNGTFESSIQLFPNTSSYDTQRFPVFRGKTSDFWRVVQDRWGALHLLKREDYLVVSFLIRRDKAAAWIPDGTFWGDASLIGGPAHPNADSRIYQAMIDHRLDER